MVSKEKLVNGSLEYVLQLLCETRYGEHNVVIYPNLDSFREIYTHIAKARIENHNDRLLLLPHYETTKSVEQALMELDIHAKEMIQKGSLEIVDSNHAFFDPEQDFLTIVDGSAADAMRAGKSGLIIVADMGSFFHRQQVDRLVKHECALSAQGQKFTIFCCYHQKDFEKLSKAQEEKICENHFQNLSVRDSPQ